MFQHQIAGDKILENLKWLFASAVKKDQVFYRFAPVEYLMLKELLDEEQITAIESCIHSLDMDMEVYMRKSANQQFEDAAHIQNSLKEEATRIFDAHKQNKLLPGSNNSLFESSILSN